MKALIACSMLVSMLVLGITAQATQATPEPAPEEQQSLYQICKDKVNGKGYGSGGWERTCQDSFDMPRPMVLRCARWVSEHSFPNQNEVKACQIYCQTNPHWGPWDDYEADNSIKFAIQQLRARHAAGTCLNP